MKAPRSAILSWTHQHYRGALFLLVMATAGLFRFYRLTTLPPGLSPVEATGGLEAVGLNMADLLAAPGNLSGSLFNVLQLVGLKTLGSTALALRLLPAVAGVAAVALCYLWARAWFGRRVAVITAFLLAVTPWAVTLSRTGISSSLVPFWQMLTLWLLTMALHRRNTLWSVLTGLSLAAGVYIDGVWWFLVLALVVAAAPAIIARARLGMGMQQILAAACALLVGLIPIIVAAATRPNSITQLFSQLPSPARLADGLARSVGMFNLHGDDSYVLNLGGMPMLNFFVGVMLIIGILILLGQLRRTKQLALFLLLVLGLVPVAIGGRPDAAKAVGALIPALVIAAIGINYMLERWYQTFPINAAARSTGLTAMVFVLAMTGYQGYNQYFIAWAQTPATFEAHSEHGVAIAKYFREAVYDGKKYLFVDPKTEPVVLFLSRGSDYQKLSPDQIDSLGADETAQFVIAKDLKDETIKKLRAKYPKARLTPYLSDYNNAELFSVFEAKK